MQLSIVTTGRNDDHGSKLLHRMQVFIDGVAEQCQRFNIDGELIIVDWNPPADTLHLHEVLDCPNGFPVRFIIVPHEIHNTLGNAHRIPFYQMIAKNVGIRRACGKWVLSTNVDLLFNDAIFTILSRMDDLLESDKFYRATRYDVGEYEVPDGNVVERLAWCRKNLVRVQALGGTVSSVPMGNVSEVTENDDLLAFINGGEGEKLFTNACGDFFLMHRDAWHIVRGHPEIDRWSIHQDSLFLYILLAEGLEQVILNDPCRVYHIEHYEGWATMSGQEKAEAMAKFPSLNPQWVIDKGKEILWQGKSYNELINGENWGFAQHDLETIEC